MKEKEKYSSSNVPGRPNASKGEGSIPVKQSTIRKRPISSTSSSDNDFLSSKDKFASHAVKRKEMNKQLKTCSSTDQRCKQSFATRDGQSLIPKGRERDLESETSYSKLHDDQRGSFNSTGLSVGLTKNVKQKCKSENDSAMKGALDLDFIPLEPTMDDLRMECNLGVTKFYGKGSIEASNKARSTSSEGLIVPMKPKPSLELSPHNLTDASSTSKSIVKEKRPKNRKTSGVRKSKLSDDIKANDKITKQSNFSIDISCTSELPGHSSFTLMKQKKKPESAITERIHKLDKLSDSKYENLPITPSNHTKKVGRGKSISSLEKPCIENHKSANMAKLQSELFGSDDEDGSSRILSHSKRSSKKRKLDSSSDEVSSNEDCFIVDKSSKSQSRSESRDKSPVWSSDDDDWSTMKASFESALSSADVTSKRTTSSALKKRKISGFKEGNVAREKLSIKSVLSKVPSVKLSRSADISSSMVAGSSACISKSPHADFYSVGDSTIKCGKEKLTSPQNDILTPNEGIFSSHSRKVVRHLVTNCDERSNGDKSSMKKSDTMTLVNLQSTQRKRLFSTSMKEACSTKSKELIKLKKPVLQDKVKGKDKLREVKGKLNKEPGKKTNQTSHQLTSGKPKVGIVKKKEPPPLTSKLS